MRFVKSVNYKHIGEKTVKDFILNPDLEYVNKIIKGIQKRKGHCPCRLDVNETTLCPCDDFIENSNCKCNLFVRKN